MVLGSLLASCPLIVNSAPHSLAETSEKYYHQVPQSLTSSVSPLKGVLGQLSQNHFGHEKSLHLWQLICLKGISVPGNNIVPQYSSRHLKRCKASTNTILRISTHGKRKRSTGIEVFMPWGREPKTSTRGFWLFGKGFCWHCESRRSANTTVVWQDSSCHSISGVEAAM